MKKILINGLLLHREFAGVQYSIEHLVDALSRLDQDRISFEILVSSDYQGKLAESKSLRLNTIGTNTNNRFRRIFFENVSLAGYFYRNHFNLYHSPACILPFLSAMPGIVTIHDLIALDFPGLCQNETALYYNMTLPASIKKAKKIIAVSETVKKDILNRFPGIPGNNIEVIYHGIDRRFKKITDPLKLNTVRETYRLPPKYILFVGNLEPKKNIGRIIEAFKLLKDQGLSDHKLVIAGKKGWKYAAIFGAITHLHLQDDIIFTGYVHEDDLPSLYSLAGVFVFPSLYEGFGLPVLEAMACGCPVVVSDRGALPEISGGIGPLVDPYSIAGIASAISAVLLQPGYRESLVGKGLQWSRRFSWEAAAAKTLLLYDSIPA